MKWICTDFHENYNLWNKIKKFVSEYSPGEATDHEPKGMEMTLEFLDDPNIMCVIHGNTPILEIVGVSPNSILQYVKKYKIDLDTNIVTLINSETLEVFYFNEQMDSPFKVDKIRRINE